MGYKSPIQLIFGSIRRQIDDGILKAVQECNIRVDRDELIRALQYDRGQYEKGYADGIAASVCVLCRILRRKADRASQEQKKRQRVYAGRV